MTKSTRRTTSGRGIKYLMARSCSPMEGPNSSQYRLVTMPNPEGHQVDSVGQSLAGLGDRVGIEPGSRVAEEHLFRILGMVEDPRRRAARLSPRALKAPFAECARGPHRHREGPVWGR